MRPLTVAFIATAAGCLLATASLARTKISASNTCAKVDPQGVVAVGDRADHNLGVAQQKCVWTKPIEIGNDKYTDGVSSVTTEVTGNKMRAQGFHVATTKSGDKTFATIRYTATVKDGELSLSDVKGTWAFTGGTGKAKGLKGKGSFTCKPVGDGANACDVEGEYELPK
jgi:hypothetical protein